MQLSCKEPCHRSPNSHKKQDLELPEGLEKTREVVGACKVRLEFLATEVTSLRANLRMLHNLPVSSSLFRKREYTVIKKI